MLDSSVFFFLIQIEHDPSIRKFPHLLAASGGALASRLRHASCRPNGHTIQMIQWLFRAKKSVLFLPWEILLEMGLGDFIKMGHVANPQKWVIPCYPPKSWDPPSPVVFSWSPGEGSDGASGGGSATCWGCAASPWLPLGLFKDVQGDVANFHNGNIRSWEHVREHPLESLEIGKYFLGPLR